MISQTQLPPILEDAFAQSGSPEDLFSAVIAALGQVLECDRCFLHVRHPETRMHRHFCWRRRPDIPDTTHDWEPEQPWEQEDPMFAAALRCVSPIYVEDVETASADVLNREFEHQLGHRALVHAHICDQEKLWGILQPAVFGKPRVWNGDDRTVIEGAIERLRSLVVGYVQQVGGAQPASHA